MIPFNIDPDKDTLCDVIRRWADVQPDAPMLVAEGCSPLTYRGTVELMEKFKTALNQSGYGIGDRVGIVHHGGAEAAAAFLGVIDSATVTIINPAFSESEFIHHFRARRVDVVLMEDGLETAAHAAAQTLSLPVIYLKSESVPEAGAIQIEPLAGKPAREPGRPGPNDMYSILTTSGTTGISKVVPMRHSHLLLRAMELQTQYRLEPEDCCLSLMPLYYSGQGRWSCVPLTGGSITFLPQFSPEDFFRLITTLKPTWYTGSFTFHNTIAGVIDCFSDTFASSHLKFAAASSGRLDPVVAEELEAKLGIPLIEGYASSETGHMAGNPRPPGKRKHGTVGPPLIKGLLIRSEDGAFLSTGEYGEVVVRGPEIFEGYENDPVANAECFVDGWFRTGDEGFIDEDGYLTITGRIKEMINRGGEKVSPFEVDGALMTHEDVQEAITFPIPHPSLGEEVAAAVVRAPGSTLTASALTDHLLWRLAGFKVPRKIIFCDQIPKIDGVKIQRLKLAEIFGVDLDHQRGEIEETKRPATPLEAQLQELWQEVLDQPQVGLNENFFLLGGDSLRAVDLLLRTEKALGVRLPTSCLFAAGTVAEMAAFIEREEVPGCMDATQKEGTKPPFFCVHGFGGEVISFSNIARHLGPDQPFYGLQAIGWNEGTVPFTKTTEMAAHYVSEIRKIQPKGTYYLGGYSFGGRISVFMANMLKDAGEEVGLLVLIDPMSLRGIDLVTLRSWLHHESVKGFTDRIYETGKLGYLKLRRGTISQLYPFARTVLSQICEYHRRAQKPLPRFLRRPDIANRLMRTEQNNLPSYSGSAIYFQTQNTRIQRQSTELVSWRRIIKGKLIFVPLDCTHDEIVQEPYSATVAQEVRAALSKAQNLAGPTNLDQDPKEQRYTHGLRGNSK